MFGQTFHLPDLAAIAVLILLEGILSIDNALVLGVLARRLPSLQQPKALTYGLAGAFIFRFIAIATASVLLRNPWIKALGGAYLVYIVVKHFMSAKQRQAEEAAREADAPMRHQARFWPTVFWIEVTDIAFAIDSIVAAIAFIGSPPADLPRDAPHPKLWVVITGGFIGVVVMRVAAVLFIKLLDRFPRFETSAYLLVLVIGLKLLIDWGFKVDFHSPTSPATWIFWALMVLCFCWGFVGGRARTSPEQTG